MSESIGFKDAFARIASDAELHPDLVGAVFEAILRGEWTPVQVAGFIVALRMRGEDATTISAAARALRGAMVPVTHGLDLVLDTCGTGGDGQGTLNLSTGAAIIAAAAGIPVAKHGNRAVSSKAGSADVLRALGIALDVPADKASEVLRRVNITFMLAPQHHPAMRHAAQARQELGIRSIFNCLGPLANPALATHQLLGAYADELRPVLAQTLASLGAKRAWVVHSTDGLDEVSPFAETRVTELSGGKLSERTVSPGDFGLERSPAGAINGGDAEENARILELVLSGGDHPSRTAFVLNGAAALVVARELAPKEATEEVNRLLGSGAVKRTLDEWRAASREFAGGSN
jgi:anthranilate phosphoribosyltransferase